jgi:20S proteasome subunit beta 3
MSLDTYNGSSSIGMVGKKCVAIAADTRFGVQFQTISTNSQKVYKIQDNILLGLNGLATDMQTFALLMKRKVELYRLKEQIDLTPKLFASLVSTTLYEKRFGPYYVGPVVVGLDVLNDYEPFVCAFDSIGCPSTSGQFEIGGTATDQLLGTCEAFFKKDMEPEELFESIGQSLVCSIERDCLSGWGGLVYLMTPGNISIRKLKVRQD